MSEKCENEIVLKSPNGKYQIILGAYDKNPGIWITNKNNNSCVAIYLDAIDRPIMGVYGPLAEGDKRDGLDACLSADHEGGHMQIIHKRANKSDVEIT